MQIEQLSGSPTYAVSSAWRKLLHRIIGAWTRSPTGRMWEIDALRGVAVVMMVVYHFMYDLYYFQVSDAIFSMRFWFYFQRATASTFILLVGISLAIAAQRSSAYDQPAWPCFWRQLRRGAQPAPVASARAPLGFSRGRRLSIPPAVRVRR